MLAARMDEACLLRISSKACKMHAAPFSILSHVGLKWFGANNVQSLSRMTYFGRSVIEIVI